VVPISVFTETYPEVLDRIMHNDIFDYYVANKAVTKGMADKEKRIYNSIKDKGPLDSMQVKNATNGLWIIDEELESLTKRGAITAASVTPTDVMVFLGKFKAGSIRGAEAAVHAIAETMGMAMNQVASVLFEEIKRKVSEAVLTKLLYDDIGDWKDGGSDKLTRKMVSLSRGRLIDILPKIKVPIVGIGAPARHMMEDIGERLGTKAVFSEDHDVGNAIGAVSSKVADSMTATIHPTVDNRYAVSVPFMGTTYHGHRDTAVSSCKKSMEDYLTQKVKRSGGTNIRTVSRVKTYLAAEGGYGGWDESAANINFIEVTTRTVGDPPQRT